MAIVYLGLMAYYNLQLTMIVVVMLALIVGLVLVSTPLLRQVSREVFNRDAAETSALVEVMTGISTIKVTAAERDLRWRWEDRFTDSLNARFRGQKLANNLQIISGLLNSVGSTALLWFGAMLVIREQLSIGQFVGFNMLFGNVTAPVMALTRLWDEFQEVVVSIERLNDVFSTEPEEDPQQARMVLPKLRGAVRYEGVTFSYGQDRNTLQTVDFDVRAGQTIAIVGASGSGKTTLLNLLQALYQPTGGRILVDGYDIRQASPRSLRSQLGVVPQDCFLFSGTIFENITLFRAEYSLEDAVRVAKLAEAHGFVQNLPLGYNTPVGERGTSLSGGQRQRIAIARALLGDPAILILDEATSSLDSESERRFQANLARIRRGRTTFIIAHRLATVRDADSILVFDQGLLIERGTHVELMEKQGVYYYLAQQQIGV
jgi:ABC-type bacteriocin/lantibiotic exporter with double-glycine peptidase domain